jgi:hypothetical protein
MGIWIANLIFLLRAALEDSANGILRKELVMGDALPVGAERSATPVWADGPRLFRKDVSAI